MVFDLDGVLSARDTFSALLVAHATRHPTALLRALPTIPGWWRSRSDTTRNAAAARRVTAAALAGLGHDGYALLADRLGAAWGADPGWVRRDVVHRLDGLRAAGHRIVVATATERRLATAFLDHAGATPDLLVASELGWDDHGTVRFVRHLRGAAKLDALVDAGVDVARSRFFTDSWDDHPTARAAAALVLVHPSTATVNRYTAAGLAFELIPAVDRAGDGHRPG